MPFFNSNYLLNFNTNLNFILRPSKFLKRYNLLDWRTSKKILYPSLILLPFIYLILMIWRYNIVAPVWDQWDFVPLLEKFYTGQVTFSDLWHQYNEHRLFFPKVIMLALAHLTHWNLSWEIGLNLLLAALIFLLLSRKITRTLMSHFGEAFTLFIPALSFLVFSLNQAESWLHSWNMQIFLNILPTILGLFLLSSPNFTFFKFAGSMGWGIIASYSYASGLVFWPVGLMIIWFSPLERRRKIIASFLWTVVATLVIAIFFAGYINVSSSLSLAAIFRAPSRYFQYVFAYLGAPLLPAEGRPQTAIILGLSGLILTIILLYFLLKSNRFKLFDLIPYLALWLYVIINSLITALGRSNFSLIQAMATRYVSLSYLFWAVLLFFLYLDIKIEKSKRRKILLSLILISCWLLIIKSSYNSRIFFKDRYEYLVPAQAELFSLQDEKLLKRIYPNLGILNKDELKNKVEFMKRNKLSIFR